MNRKFEEVLGMTREYDTISVLWGTFYGLMRGPTTVLREGTHGETGMPGTGGHTLSTKQPVRNAFFYMFELGRSFFPSILGGGVDAHTGDPRFSDVEAFKKALNLPLYLLTDGFIWQARLACVIHL
jgi:DASH complex subunit Dad1